MSTFESELESEFESELEGEGILGSIGNVLGGLLGEGEEETASPHHEFEAAGHLPELEGHPAHEYEGLSAHEYEGHPMHEYEGLSAHEYEGLSAHEYEGHPAHEYEGHPAHEYEGLSAHEYEGHPMHEYEGLSAHEYEGHPMHEEQFFKRIARGIGRFVRRAAPIFKRIASIAAPIVGTAIGGPFGAALGKVASSALGEEELAHQHELFGESEFELTGGVHESTQAAHEIAHEIVHHEVTHHEAMAEMMAQQAAFEHNEGQAEAMVGAAVITVLSPRDRRDLRRILPHLIRGVAVLTRILRRRRITRPAVRAVPTIVRRTVQTLKRQAAAGEPITRRAAARAAATQVRQVLGNPSICTAAISQNLRANRMLRRTSARSIAG
jgi:nitrogen regulatory protein PII-like uncharacterized protein